MESEYSIDAYVIVKDLAKTDAPGKIYDELNSEGIKIEYLINNAGIADYGFFHKTNWDKEAAMIDLNIKSLTGMTKLFARDTVDRKSSRKIIHWKP